MTIRYKLGDEQCWLDNKAYSSPVKAYEHRFEHNKMGNQLILFVYEDDNLVGLKDIKQEILKAWVDDDHGRYKFDQTAGRLISKQARKILKESE